MYLSSSSTTNNYWFNTIEDSKLKAFPNTQPTLFKYVEKTVNSDGTIEYKRPAGVYMAAGFYYNFENIPFKYGNDISNFPYNCGMINTVTINGTTYNSSNTTTVKGNTLFKLNNNVSRVRLLTIEEVNNILQRPHTYKTSLGNTEYNDQQTTIPEGEPKASEYVKSLIEVKYIANISGMSNYSYDVSGSYFLASPGQGYSIGVYVFNCASGGLHKNIYGSSHGLRPVIEFKSSSAKFDWSSSNNCWIMSE